MVITRTFVFIAATVLTLAACGGRSSKTPPFDAGADAKADTGADAKPIDFFAYLPSSDAGPVLACMGCFKSQCGDEMNACANNVNCREGLMCALGQCSVWTSALSGSVSSGISSADLTCISTCFKGDLASALLAAKSASCATTACRKACESVFPTDAGADGPSPTRLDGNSLLDSMEMDTSTHEAALPGLDGNSLLDSMEMDTSSHEAALPGTGDAPNPTDAPNVTTVDGAVDTGL